MTNERLHIPDHQADFIRSVIASGRYDDVNEVIQAGVVLLEEQLAHEERQKGKLGEILDDAMAGGVSNRTPEQIWEDVEARHPAEDA